MFLVFYSKKTQFYKNLYLKVNGLNSKFKIAGDFDLEKICKFEKLIPLNIKYACHRKNNNQLSGNLKPYYEEIGKKQCKFNIFYPVRFIASIIYFPIFFFRT